MEVSSVAVRLEEAGITDAEELSALATTSWRVEATRTLSAKLKIGQSRLGGVPDVPESFVWPTRDGRRLAFLAQIDLSDLSSADLPATGWLLFFYDYAEQPWGFDPKDAGGARVEHVDVPRDALVRLDSPGDDDGEERFDPSSILMTPTIDLPHPWDSIIARAGVQIPSDQQEEYAEVTAAISGVEEDALYHHLLGHPQLVQNDMRGECELVTNGIYCGDPSGYESVRARELLGEAPAAWQLLLQLDSDEDGPGWMWGDMGRIYFWIRRSDLAARAFDKAWLVLQCG